jgi:hypothetical protein
MRPALCSRANAMNNNRCAAQRATVERRNGGDNSIGFGNKITFRKL